MRSYHFVVERDPEIDLLVGYVPGWPGERKQIRHRDGRSTTVPFHAGRDTRPRCGARSPRKSISRWTNRWVSVERAF
jgi:hypothetical protein